MNRPLILVLYLTLAVPARSQERASKPDFEREVLPVLKNRCVRCHGPAKREGKLNLATPRSLVRGGKHGPVISAANLSESLLWARIDAEEMPPDEPLEEAERNVIRRWVEQGAPGLPVLDPTMTEKADHWAFGPIREPATPVVKSENRVRTAVDRFVLGRLEQAGLTFAPDAEPGTLVRRIALDLTGLPPSPEEIATFHRDWSQNRETAISKLVDHFLASPHYGERWGKYWLDTAGYADSNGYFSADTDRPLAFRYRDYVVRSFNIDKPFDQFVVEQLAGDELTGFKAGGPVTPETIDGLTATHFLRNGPDGTGESDGNPDEVRADKFAVLEGATQIIGSSLLGLTLQCARCHDHKFEPITQRDYYALYAILQPAFDLEHWVKPQARVVEARLPDEAAAWEETLKQLKGRLDRSRSEFKAWVQQHRPRGQVVFRDEFETSTPLSARWSATAPGDDAPAGAPAVRVDSPQPPGAVVVDGALRIVEGGDPGNRWLSTRDSFDWSPETKGGWIQVTFDLVDVRLDPGGKPAERVAYYLALNDYQDNGPTGGGNILLDGNPAGGATVIVDYPGTDSRNQGTIGQEPYQPGVNYGVRITHAGRDRYRLEHLVDGAPEGKSVTLRAEDLPDGGFGFEFCCGRSFIVDNVLIETGSENTPDQKTFRDRLAAERKVKDAAAAALEAHQNQKPGRIAWVSNVNPGVRTHLLNRGLYTSPGETVGPAPPEVLTDPEDRFQVGPDGAGRRLAFARWLTRPGSRPAARLARLTVNRVWQDHFGTGLTPTSENLGYSGAPPSHPELLEFLASELIRGGWRLKPIHRLIVNSSAYLQASDSRQDGLERDPGNLLLWHFPVRRLDSEAIRDGMLAASGELDLSTGGPYVPTRRESDGEITVSESAAGAHRRSVYLQQRRTQIVTLLDVFDAPSIVASCTRRSSTTVPTQALNLLNSDFVARRAQALSVRIQAEAGDEPARIDRAFLLTIGRGPTVSERQSVQGFLRAQQSTREGREDAEQRTWTDLCQVLLMSNAYLYVD